MYTFVCVCVCECECAFICLCVCIQIVGEAWGCLFKVWDVCVCMCVCTKRARKLQARLGGAYLRVGTYMCETCMCMYVYVVKRVCKT